MTERGFGDRVWNIGLWLWNKPITWGQLILYVLVALALDFIAHLLH